jgi:hypothetical protein
MVARDGIEPPTPAFSGPRSTTELPGLSADFRCIFLRGIPENRKGWAWSTNSALQQLCQYINFAGVRPAGAGAKIQFPVGAKVHKLQGQPAPAKRGSGPAEEGRLRV